MIVMQFCRTSLHRCGPKYVRFHGTGQVRVRFAPSPTGFLHLGGLRTALYNFLFARANNGKFVLRIEDTDQTRIVQGAAEQLHKDLTWAGIEIDEGPQTGGVTSFGPYVQSQRLEIYRDHVQTLLANGSAYHCFCTDKRLELLRREALRARQVPKYDNRCRDLSREEAQIRLDKGDASCVRFKMSAGVHKFTDLVYGDIAYDVTANEGDPVIVKTDGYPTYHFANVVDDRSMEITHVLRGVEWQISTTKHLMMYRAFNWSPPAFAHLPLLVNADGTKLSKRQGDIRISHYRDSGIFPLALINFITNAGGGFEKDLQKNLKPRIHTLEELTEQFDISRINPNSSKLMPERLSEYNRLELKRQLENDESLGQLTERVKEMLRSTFPERTADGSLDTSPEHIRYVLRWSVNRIARLQDLMSKDLQFIWVNPSSQDMGKSDRDLSFLVAFLDELSRCDDLSRDNLNTLFRRFCEERSLNFRTFMKTLRAVLSGLKEGPSVAEMVEILGKDTTMRRLKASIHHHDNKQEQQVR